MKKTELFLVVCIAVLISHIAMAHIVEEAAIYLPFEGTIGSDPNSQCWLNLGAAGFDETPGVMGQEPNGSLPTITLDGLNGQAFDSTGLIHLEKEDTYGYGLLGNTSEDPNFDTDLERSMINIWSFTVTGWIKDQGQNAARILRCPAFEINHNSWQLQVALDRDDPNSIFYGSNSTSQNFGSLGVWKFFAVTYDGTIAANNLKMYYGTEISPLTLDSVQSADWGRLERDGDGSILVLGNAGYEDANRPFIGYIDEVRIWADGPGEPNEPNNAAVLTMEELESIRQYDLTVPSSCTAVHRMGYSLSGDVDKDCYVRLDDFAKFAVTWMGCNDPNDLYNCEQNW